MIEEEKKALILVFETTGLIILGIIFFFGPNAFLLTHPDDFTAPLGVLTYFSASAFCFECALWINRDKLRKPIDKLRKIFDKLGKM